MSYFAYFFLRFLRVLCAIFACLFWIFLSFFLSFRKFLQLVWRRCMRHYSTPQIDLAYTFLMPVTSTVWFRGRMIINCKTHQDISSPGRPWTENSPVGGGGSTLCSPPLRPCGQLSPHDRSVPAWTRLPANAPPVMPTCPDRTASFDRRRTHKLSVL